MTFHAFTIKSPPSPLCTVGLYLSCTISTAINKQASDSETVSAVCVPQRSTVTEIRKHC